MYVEEVEDTLLDDMLDNTFSSSCYNNIVPYHISTIILQIVAFKWNVLILTFRHSSHCCWCCCCCCFQFTEQVIFLWMMCMNIYLWSRATFPCNEIFILILWHFISHYTHFLCPDILPSTIRDRSPF